MSEESTQYFPQDDLKRILASLVSIGARLTALEDKVDRRLLETRPIWEQVLGRLDHIDNRMNTIENRMNTIENRLDSIETEMRSGFRKLERQVGLLAEDVLVVRADQRDLEKRVSKLESEPAQ